MLTLQNSLHLLLLNEIQRFILNYFTSKIEHKNHRIRFQLMLNITADNIIGFKLPVAKIVHFLIDYFIAIMYNSNSL